jgi:sigma-B regulation protein RsbU (phosphoserine phosphatase)
MNKSLTGLDQDGAGGRCQRCRQRPAVRTLIINEPGRQERLRLCASCFRIMRGPRAAGRDSDPSFRLKAQRLLRLRQRIGLLKNTGVDEELSDVERKMLDHELAIAEELQANLLPKKMPQIPGYDISAYYRPSREVGGDYYDFIDIDADHLGILVADVSGKGIPGSIVMTETRALVKSEAVRTRSPAETLTRVNRVLYNDIKRGMFVTLYYVICQISTGVFTCVSAGHNPMVIWRNASNTCHLVNPNGLALGIDKGPLFEKTLKEQRIQLFPGDRFVLYTDGVIESMNENQEEFGQNRFFLRIKQLANRSSSELLSLIVAELEAHQGMGPQHDDITLVTGRTVVES